jgi:hypothetical protein
LYGSAKASGGSFIVCGPAIVREIDYRKAIAVEGIHEFGGVEISFVQIETGMMRKCSDMNSLAGDAHAYIESHHCLITWMASEKEVLILRFPMDGFVSPDLHGCSAYTPCMNGLPWQNSSDLERGIQLHT